ncbi:hypothetical protein KQI84_11140 [bacterium]|nr:hypothetical protein [bacterium]
MRTLLLPRRSEQGRTALRLYVILAMLTALVAVGCDHSRTDFDNDGPVLAVAPPLGENPSMQPVLAALGALRDPATGFGGQKVIPWQFDAPGSSFVDAATGEAIATGNVLMPAGVGFSEDLSMGLEMTGTDLDAWVFVPGYLPKQVKVAALLGLEDASVEFERALYGVHVGKVWGAANEAIPTSLTPPAGAIHRTQYEDFTAALKRRGYNVGGLELLDAYLADPAQVPVRSVVVTGLEDVEQGIFDVQDPLLTKFYAAGEPAQLLLPSDSLNAMLLKAGALTTPLADDPVIDDNEDAKFSATGNWETRRNSRETSTYGLNALVTDDPEAEALWIIEGLEEGRHATWLYWDHRVARSKKALLEIGLVEQGRPLVTWEIDMTTGTGAWNRLGDWVAISSRPLFVRLRTGDGRTIMADAIKFQPLPEEDAQ